MKRGDWVGISLMLLALVFFGWIILGANSEPELSYLPVDLDTGSIEINGQNDEGTEVYLTVELGEPGWVSIHNSMSGAPTDIIGVSDYLEVGTHEITVDVQAMLPGFAYITLLKMDNGDQRFVQDDDLPVRVNGSVVRPDFTFKPDQVQIPAPGTADNQ